MTVQIDAEAVRTLVRAQGHEWVTDEVAQRIAAAANVAVASVTAALPAVGGTMFEDPAAEFLALLDRLAEPVP